MSCKKIVDVPFPEDRISKDEVFTSDATAASAIAGLYIRLHSANQFSNSAITIYPGLSADEIIIGGTNSVNEEFFNNSISSSNTSLRLNLWASGYNLIFQANNIIEGLEKSKNVSAELKNQIIGEAKFIRAFCHFYILNLFGDIPLITTTDYQINQNMPRIASTLVYEKIIDDLKDAEALTSVSYPSAGKVRINKWAATALLSRVYLYLKDWTKAEEKATSIINSGTYSLVTNLNNVFLANSNEAIWQIIPSSSTYNTVEGNTFIPGSGAIPTYPLNSYLLNAFQAGDQRKTNWTKSVTVAGTTYYYPFKYKVKTSSTITEYYMMMRYAELFLIRAEARAHLNNIGGAIGDLNIIRTRAGLSNTNAITVDEILLAVEQEMQCEFFCEWGHRWMDLKRMDHVDGVLGISKAPSWQSTDALYPIPNSEIQRNPALIQNPGY